MWVGLKLYSNLRRVDFTFSYISSGTRCVPWCFQILCYICDDIFTTLSFKVCMCELCEPQCCCWSCCGQSCPYLCCIPWWYGFMGRQCPSKVVLHSFAPRAFIHSHSFSAEVILDLSERPSTLYIPWAVTDLLFVWHFPLFEESDTDRMLPFIIH